MADPLLIIVITAVIAVLLNIFLKKQNIPPIIGYIFAGAVVGEWFGLNYAGNHQIQIIAEFGIVFLMFTIALEFSVSRLAKMKKEVLFNGIIQVVFSAMVLSFIAHHLFGIDTNSAIVIGSALALSSTAIVLKTLNDTRDIGRPYGRFSLGILLFQDIAVIPILLMITIFSATDKSVADLFLETAINAAIALAILFFFGKYVLDRFLRIVSETNTSEIFVASILIIVIASAIVAHNFGFSYSLGAFIAGMMIAETHYKFQIEADLEPFRDLLLGVFFVTVGLQVNFAFLFEHFFTILAMMVGIMLIKWLIIFGLVRLSTNTKVAFKTALAISQIGEFSFAVFEIARMNQLMPEYLGQILLIAVIFSMILTPFILRLIDPLADTIFAKERGEIDYNLDEAETKNHIIICGYGTIGKSAAARLKEIGMPYLIIEHTHTLAMEAKGNGDPVIFGNAAQQSLLKNAGIEDATAVIIAIEDEEKIRIITEAINAFTFETNIVAKVSNRDMFAKMEGVPLRHLINGNEEIAKIMVYNALTCNLK